jgi:cysteine desulfurase family protein (TIGR01976 family)
MASLECVRRQFPALARTHDGRPVVYLDGPAGTQVPQCVIDAVGDCLARTNANRGGAFATSRECDERLDQASQAVADFLGAADPCEVAFGPNMTTLTLAVSRALARTWRPGDEIVCTRLEHDANVTPWVLAARDAGATVRFAAIHPEDATLDLDDLRAQLSPRTRLVAVTHASNLSGSIVPAREVVAAAHAVGALVYVDAVHYAPHGLIDVQALGCDFLVCSAYKFFGPHVGILWGRRQLFDSIQPYKLRPSPDDSPERWMTGTQNHEGIMGTAAAIDYLAGIGQTVEPTALTRRPRLIAAFDAIREHEQALAAQLLAGLARQKSLSVWGIADPARVQERVPTISFTHASRAPREVVERLAASGIFAWSGNNYALPLTEALRLEPQGVVRVGMVHYNTAEEVDRLLEAVSGM